MKSEQSSKDYQRVAEAIFRRYAKHWDGEVQGCCILIADEIHRAIGGEIVAGWLVWLGSNRRTHWWVEKDGITIDPMGDWMFLPEDYMHREESHRDPAIFERLIGDYEQWRAA